MEHSFETGREIRRSCAFGFGHSKLVSIAQRTAADQVAIYRQSQQRRSRGSRKDHQRCWGIPTGV